MDPVTLTHSSMPNPEDPALPQLGLESPKRGQPIAAGGAHPLRHISPSERPWLAVGCGFYQVCWAWPPRTQERPLCGVRTILCSGEEKLIERQGARLGKTLKQWRLLRPRPREQPRHRSDQRPHRTPPARCPRLPQPGALPTTHAAHRRRPVPPPPQLGRAQLCVREPPGHTLTFKKKRARTRRSELYFFCGLRRQRCRLRSRRMRPVRKQSAGSPGVAGMFARNRRRTSA